MVLTDINTRVSIIYPNLGAPIYLPGIDMGEIDALSRMRDDETEASARIKELCMSESHH
jgi:hypothetical protein